MPSSRAVLVGTNRLEGWLSRFADRNGGYAVAGGGDPGARDGGLPAGSVRIEGGNGCVAVLSPPLPPAAPTSADTSPLQALLTGVDTSVVVGLLLIRRGGYSVGAARAGGILPSKTGPRYVQGRTAAGGGSPQRFARRRANQADALVEETALRAAALFDAHPPACLQLGGDRTLAAAALAEPVLARYTGLPRPAFLTVPDPRLAVLQDAARSALSVRITVTDPPA
ncbi:hypothetical protein AC792_08195 [Arthrobacter sp. RIT-PI-e]|uniref:acVLRF1 family peptidyl-tRNA hydrolase n=1 Tax=Arthrobacter sp. RIT-PI-e TaxID=1681197 RepID=UPI0006768B0A|nr:acVLRF1 family peptidyl-tRNA hydrolase [Arthrobacter sp. RIT-PI-e]KNC19091.1 hypothetical protein AC792_08195 [Arthrobacter sp. RIT-PI-e]